MRAVLIEHTVFPKKPESYYYVVEEAKLAQAVVIVSFIALRTETNINISSTRQYDKNRRSYGKNTSVTVVERVKVKCFQRRYTHLFC